MYIHNIRKNYGSTQKILKYHRGINIEPPRCEVHQQIACQICWERSTNPVPSPTSLQRSKTTITDYTLTNEFDLFTTFTFNPELVDSFNIQEAKAKMSKWLNHARRHSPDLMYLIVPELHKSGRIHFHALMKNYLGDLPSAHRTKNGRPILNIPGWKFGYSTAIRIDDIGKVSSYMQKYITKDMLKIGNKKRFWASRNLKKPTKEYNVNMLEDVFKRPLFVTGKKTFEYYTVYRLVTFPDPVLQARPKTKRPTKKQEFAHSWG